jgi:shikimate kinase
MLLERVSRNNDRPLLQNGDKKKILEKLMDERHPIYAESDLVVDSDMGPHYKVVEEIIWKL